MDDRRAALWYPARRTPNTPSRPYVAETRDAGETSELVPGQLLVVASIVAWMSLMRIMRWRGSVGDGSSPWCR